MQLLVMTDLPRFSAIARQEDFMSYSCGFADLSEVGTKWLQDAGLPSSFSAKST